jgi:hypothetical protein
MENTQRGSRTLTRHGKKTEPRRPEAVTVAVVGKNFSGYQQRQLVKNTEVSEIVPAPIIRV